VANPIKPINKEVEVLIVTRTVAHYRLPVLQELYNQYGWITIVAKNFPNQTQNLQMATDYPFIQAEEFWFPRPKNPWLCHIPLKKLRQKYNPKLFIIEGGSLMSSTWIAPLCQRIKKIIPHKKSPKVALWMIVAPITFGTSSWRRYVAKVLKRWIVNGLNAVIVYSEKDAHYLKPLSNTPTFITRNTLDMRPMQARQTSIKPYIKHHAPVCIATGRLTSFKRFDLMIEAFLGFLEHQPDAHLYIIGDGPILATLKAQAGAALNKNIFFTGAIYDEDTLASYYNSAHISIIGGTAGLSVNHALAYGVPVMAFKEEVGTFMQAPEVASVIDDVTGWQVAPYKPEAMTAQLAHVFANGQNPKQKLAKSLSNYVNNNLQLEHMVECFSQVRAHFFNQ